MKLSDAFLTHEVDDQHLLIATGKAEFSGLVRSNKTAAFIIECLKNETTASEIKQKMAEKFDAPAEVISKDVDEVLDKLRLIGAVTE